MKPGPTLPHASGPAEPAGGSRTPAVGAGRPAAPAIGGMLSSLVHILIVTPAIFAILHERKLRREPAFPNV